MRLANLDAFWVLLSAAAVFLLVRKGALLRARQQAALADSSLYPRLCPGFLQLSEQLRRRLFLLPLAAVCFSLAVLRPQWGFTWREASKAGVDILIAVDTSDSMLAEDLSPSRLVRAQREIADLLARFQGDRVGLLLFAGTAFLEVPLTLDYSVVKLFLSSLSTDLIPIKGTDVGAAIREGAKALIRGSQPTGGFSLKSNRERALLLITDGEDFGGDLEGAGRFAKENGVRIFIMGIGTAQGAPIPGKEGYKLDENGSVVISRLSEAALERLAQDTGGIYVRSISSDEDAQALYDAGIRSILTASTLKWSRSKRWNEYFQLPLLLGIVILLAAWAPRTAPPPAASSPARIEALRTARGVVIRAVLLALLLSPAAARAQNAEALGAEGARLFEQAQYEKSLNAFQKGEQRELSDFRFKQGKGSSYYRMKAFGDAKREFLAAAQQAKDKKERAGALYNAANSMVQLGEVDEAVKRYDESLALNPEDRDAVDNREFAKWLQRQKQQSDKRTNPEQNQGKQDENERSSASSAQEDGEQKPGAPPPDTPAEDMPPQTNSGGADGQPEKERENSSRQEDGARKEPFPGSEQNRPQAPRQGDAGGQRRSVDQFESLLNSIEEDPEYRAKYRQEQSLRQAGERAQRLPDKDW